MSTQTASPAEHPREISPRMFDNPILEWGSRVHPIVPPLIYPGDPNFKVVRQAVQAKIDAAEAADAKLANPQATPVPSSVSG